MVNLQAVTNSQGSEFNEDYVPTGDEAEAERYEDLARLSGSPGFGDAMELRDDLNDAGFGDDPDS